jgi:hypothetical protein
MANYSIQAVTDLYVIIIDDLHDDLPSLTNSAGAVVTDLNLKVGGLGSRKIYYRDSIMRYDEIKHLNGKFVGFAPCKPAQQEFLRNQF